MAKKKQNKPTMLIKFDEKAKTHKVIVDGMSGEQMIMSALTIIKRVERDSGMPFGAAVRLGKMHQDAEADKVTQANIKKANKKAKAKAKKKGKKNGKK